MILLENSLLITRVVNFSKRISFRWFYLKQIVHFGIFLHLTKMLIQIVQNKSYFKYYDYTVFIFFLISEVLYGNLLF